MEEVNTAEIERITTALASAGAVNKKRKEVFEAEREGRSDV